jgi:hypothetical protein
MIGWKGAKNIPEETDLFSSTFEGQRMTKSEAGVPKRL